MNVLLVGSGAREHAIARALDRSPTPCNIFCFASANNPGIASLATLEVGTITDSESVISFAKRHNVDTAIIGPEAPLAVGVVDALHEEGIWCFGPTKKLAQIETSKSFTRDLLQRHGIDVSPRFKRYNAQSGIATMLDILGEDYVIKADGLMGGKGVKVSKDHLENRHQGYAWCQSLIREKVPFLIEEKLIGQEFSFISLSDGKNLVHTIPVQDHKRAYDGDTGPNTGGMGTYSGPFGTLPFLRPEDIAQAKQINHDVWTALQKECGQPYVGVMYGGFIATKNGVKLIEYNARFGDPEAMNIFELLTSDFVKLLDAMRKQELTQSMLTFSDQASVCVYAVPDGYPQDPVRHQPFYASMDNESLYVGAASQEDEALVLTGSRTIAAVGVGETIETARAQAYNHIRGVSGPVWTRSDIAASNILEQRIAHMNSLIS